MEISLVSSTSIRIKGKQGAIVINPSSKLATVNGVILLQNASFDKKSIEEGTLTIQGPGEYEIAGIKISGFQHAGDVLYSIRVDKVEILFGLVKTLEKDYSKLKEHNIVLGYADVESDPTFATSLATNIIMFYGEKSEETVMKLAKEGFTKESKYTTTFEKLPLEIEKVLLQ
jgi:hypothetical protein